MIGAEGGGFVGKEHKKRNPFPYASILSLDYDKLERRIETDGGLHLINKMMPSPLPGEEANVNKFPHVMLPIRGESNERDNANTDAIYKATSFVAKNMINNAEKGQHWSKKINPESLIESLSYTIKNLNGVQFADRDPNSHTSRTALNGLAREIYTKMEENMKELVGKAKEVLDTEDFRFRGEVSLRP
ncbi:MAG: hypothetical protein AABY33_00550 [Pseudomonadota bacterium]